MRSLIYFAAVSIAAATALASSSANAQEKRVVVATGEPEATRSTQPIDRVLAAADSWVVDYADDHCSLIRRFGPSDAPVLFRMRQFGPDQYAEFTIMGEDLDFELDEPVDARFVPTVLLRTNDRAYKIRFPNGDGILFDASFHIRDANGDGDSKQDSPSDAERKAAAAAIKQFELRGVLKEPIALSTGAMDEPISALRMCIDDLYRSWGVDLAALEGASRRARAIDKERWARKLLFSYPESALLRGLSGSVPLTLVINEEGRVEHCIAQLPYKDETLEEAACRGMIRYSRFDPALDSSGQPIKDHVKFQIEYVIR